MTQFSWPHIATPIGTGSSTTNIYPPSPIYTTQIAARPYTPQDPEGNPLCIPLKRLHIIRYDMSLGWKTWCGLWVPPSDSGNFVSGKDREQEICKRCHRLSEKGNS